MKLIQVNAWGGRLDNELPRFLQREQPDFVCLQEVYDLPGSSGALFAPFDKLREFSGLTHGYMAPVHAFHYMNREAKYGIALLSKEPLEDRESVFVQGDFVKNYDDEANTEYDHARNFQHAAISLHGKKLHLINYHGTFIREGKAGNTATEKHVKMIADYASQFANEPMIICGDFNLAPDSASMQQLSHGFTSLTKKYQIASTYSPVLHVFNVVCDYIFVNDSVKVNDFKVSEAVISDHKALILDFTV